MNSLVEFLRDQKRKLTRVQEERAKTVKEWLSHLERLFTDIEAWLEPAKKEGLEIERGKVEISEEYLGTYVAPVLEIAFAGTRVRLEPVGRHVIGALGRVDVFSPLGVHKLVLLTDGWYLVIGKPEQRLPLTQDTFEDFLIRAFSA
jgi:hypothetical protein